MINIITIGIKQFNKNYQHYFYITNCNYNITMITKITIVTTTKPLMLPKKKNNPEHEEADDADAEDAVEVGPVHHLDLGLQKT